MFLKRSHIFFRPDELIDHNIDPNECQLTWKSQRPGGRVVHKRIKYSLPAKQYIGLPRGYVEKKIPLHILKKALIDCTTEGLPLGPGVKFSGVLKKNLKQDIAVKRTVDRLRNSPTSCATLSLPCGWGKTACAIAIASIIGRRMFVLVHTKILANQWAERVSQFLPSTQGKIQVLNGSNDTPHESTLVCIGLMQSLSKSDREEQMSNRFSQFGMIIVDEAHHCPCDSIRQSMMCFGGRYTLGLTATPYRADGLTDYIKWSLGEPAFVVPPQFLSCVCEKVVFKKQRKTTRESIILSSVSGTTLIDSLAADEERNEFVVRLAISAAQEKQCGVLVVTTRRAHAQALFDESMKWMHVSRLGLIMGGVERGVVQEKNSEEACEFGAHVIISTIQMVCEGFDRGNSLKVLVMAAPRSHGDDSTWLCQSVGRVCRAGADQNNQNNQNQNINSIVYDIVDESIPTCKQSFRQRQYGYTKFGITLK